MDEDRDLLVRGVAAAKAGDKSLARKYLQLVLAIDPPMDQQVEAWNALAEIADTDEERRDYVSQVLAYDPTNGTARRTLAMLDGRLRAGDIINPDRLPPHEASGQIDSQRLSCPRCGSGRLTSSRNGTTLVCEYCGYTAAVKPSAAPVANQDFYAAMWSAKGHRSSQRTQTFACAACGAAYVLEPDTHSLTCSFCGSVHVALQTETRDLIGPDGFLPFRLSVGQVREALESEFTLAHGPFPLYLPVWQFNFAGTVHWSGYDTRHRNDDAGRLVPVSGDYPILDLSALVSATTQLPESLEYLIDECDLSALAAYDPRQLSDRPVAAYQLALDDASLRGRRKALAAVGEEVKEEESHVQNLNMKFTAVDVDTYKLLLLPLWIAKPVSRNTTNLIVVNDQTGSVGRS